MAINFTKSIDKNDYEVRLPKYVRDFIASKLNNILVIKIYEIKNNKIKVEYEDIDDIIKYVEYDREFSTLNFNDNANLVKIIYKEKNGKFYLMKKNYHYPDNNNSITRIYNTKDGYFKYKLNINNETYDMEINYFYNRTDVDSLKEINKLIVNDFYKSYHDPAYSDVYSKYADDIMKIVFDGNLHFDSLYEIYEHLNKYLVLNKAGLRLDKDDSNLFVSRNYVYNYNEYFIKDGIKYHIYKKNIQSNEPVFYVEEVIDKEIGNIEDTKEFIKKIGRK